MGLDGIKRESVTRQAYDRIRRSILDGAMQPGERLREARIARDLGVSRSPVREALRLLEADGLVELRPGRGTFVKDLTLGEMQEACMARKVLGGYVTGRAAEEATPEDVARLREAVRRIEDLAATEDYVEAVNADLEFHRMIWEISGHKLLYGILTRLGVQCCFYVIMQHAAEAYAGQGEEVAEDHRRLVDAIAAGDATAARVLAAEHAEATAAIVFDYLRAAQGDKSGERGNGNVTRL